MDRSDPRNPRSGGGEPRTFPGGHGEGEHEPWRRDRYGSLYDQDRTNYGSGYDPQRGEYGRGEDDRRAPRGGPQDARAQPSVDDDAAYLSWRDEQLRRHDREYQAWRRDRSREYDEAYRRSRGRR